MADQLVGLLKAIRKAHSVSQKTVEKCMELPEGTLRHIERGRRNLPDYRDGLVTWIISFENCIGATDVERRQIYDELSHEIVEQFSHLLDGLLPKNDTD